MNYFGVRGKNGTVVYKVSREDGEGTVPLPLYIDELYKSPTGFEWGYLGSGPAQLAYAILRDFTEHFYKQRGYNGHDSVKSKEVAMKYYCTFKEQMLSPIKENAWLILEQDILKFIDRAKRKMEI